MKADFYYNKSDPNYIVKTISPMLSNITIDYIEDNNLVKPVFKMQGTYAIGKKNINYVYVRELNRYYYVDEIVYAQQYVELHCTVDVLMSFQSDIKNTSCVIRRSQNRYNLYISDEKMRTEAQSRIIKLPFEGGFYSAGNKVANFILTLNGGGYSGGGD